MFPSRPKPRTLPAFGKPAGFQRECRHDRERVVQFEHVNIIRADAGLLVGFLGRLVCRRQEKRISAGHGGRSYRWQRQTRRSGYALLPLN